MRTLLLAVLLLAPTLRAQQPDLTPEQKLEQLQAKYNDFAGLQYYTAENAKLPPATSGRVVFLGDSITRVWGHSHGSFFPGKPYVNRGISAQTTSQMVLRFPQDVLHLQPAAVVILAGTNDVAEHTGPITDPQIEDNIRSMVVLARQSHIRVILGSIPPADRFPWNPAIAAPAERIRTLNAWLRSYAAAEQLIYLDYYSALATSEGAMKPELAADKFVHPNDAGYALMQPLAEAAIKKALAQPPP